MPGPCLGGGAGTVALKQGNRKQSYSFRMTATNCNATLGMYNTRCLVQRHAIGPWIRQPAGGLKLPARAPSPPAYICWLLSRVPEQDAQLGTPSARHCSLTCGCATTARPGRSCGPLQRAPGPHRCKCSCQCKSPGARWCVQPAWMSGPLRRRWACRSLGLEPQPQLHLQATHQAH